jgi:hypothetical protein
MGKWVLESTDEWSVTSQNDTTSTDSAKNMINMMTHLPAVRHARCVCHILQLCIQVLGEAGAVQLL